MAIPNKADLKKIGVKKEKVSIPEWGKDAFIYIKHPNLKETFTLSAIQENEIANEDKMVEIVMLFCVDEKGDKYFQEEDRDWLVNQEAKVVMKLANKAVELMVGKQDLDERAKN